jgi:hypothetical protein
MGFVASITTSSSSKEARARLSAASSAASFSTKLRIALCGVGNCAFRLERRECSDQDIGSEEIDVRLASVVEQCCVVIETVLRFEDLSREALVPIAMRMLEMLNALDNAKQARLFVEVKRCKLANSRRLHALNDFDWLLARLVLSIARCAGMLYFLGFRNVVRVHRIRFVVTCVTAFIIVLPLLLVTLESSFPCNT